MVITPTKPIYWIPRLSRLTAFTFDCHGLPEYKKLAVPRSDLHPTAKLEIETHRAAHEQYREFFEQDLVHWWGLFSSAAWSMISISKSLRLVLLSKSALPLFPKVRWGFNTGNSKWITRWCMIPKRATCPVHETPGEARESWFTIAIPLHGIVPLCGSPWMS